MACFCTGKCRTGCGCAQQQASSSHTLGTWQFRPDTDVVKELREIKDLLKKLGEK